MPAVGDLVHCVQAQSRTPTAAALYGARLRGIGPTAALADVCGVAWRSRNWPTEGDKPTGCWFSGQARALLTL